MSGAPENEFWAAMWALLAGGIVGAKALFVVLGWEHYARGDLRFWADFSVGFVFFGGLLGAVLTGAVFARLRRLEFMRGADYFAVAVPLGHAIGRIGCFFAGCCHGRSGHPVQLYEALGLALVALTCRHVLGRVEAGVASRGTAFRVYLAFYGALRVLLDPLRADGRPERFLDISHQQGIALCAIALALVWQRAAGTRLRRASRSAWGPPRRSTPRQAARIDLPGCAERDSAAPTGARPANPVRRAPT